MPDMSEAKDGGNRRRFSRQVSQAFNKLAQNLIIGKLESLFYW